MLKSRWLSVCCIFVCIWASCMAQCCSTMCTMYVCVYCYPHTKSEIAVPCENIMQTHIFTSVVKIFVHTRKMAKSVLLPLLLVGKQQHFTSHSTSGMEYDRHSPITLQSKSCFPSSPNTVFEYSQIHNLIVLIYVFSVSLVRTSIK